ncbi:MAG: hypothetical protein ACQERN_06175 [Thermodesulfobacteriota bacterium]
MNIFSQYVGAASGFDPMKLQSNHPMNYFKSWFHTVPVLHQQHIARLFILCTTENSADFALSPEDALVRFQNYISGADFHLRVCSRLMILCAVFDLIFNNRKRFMSMDQELAGSGQGRNVARLSEKQWEKTEISWRNFRGRALTDKVIYAWLQKAT